MPHRILCVDDDAQVLNYLTEYLGKRLGYEVATAKNGMNRRGGRRGDVNGAQDPLPEAHTPVRTKCPDACQSPSPHAPSSGLRLPSPPREIMDFAQWDEGRAPVLRAMIVTSFGFSTSSHSNASRGRRTSDGGGCGRSAASGYPRTSPSGSAGASPDRRKYL